MFDENDVRNLQIVKDSYSADNYRIEYTDSSSGRCLLCFSGNGLYYPNDAETFQHVIQEKDRFEWTNINRSDAIRKHYKKIIYVRDIWKSWYISGISSKYPDTDSMLSFLKAETDGYELYTVGNSAGGYAAVLFGCLLSAKAIYNFSGQYRTCESDIQPLFDVIPVEIASIYRDLYPVIQDSPSAIIYFMPSDSEDDIEEYEHIKDLPNVFPCKIRSAYHGTTVLADNYRFIFTLPVETLYRLSSHTTIYSRRRFLFKTAGLTAFFVISIRNIVRKITRKGSTAL